MTRFWKKTFVACVNKFWNVSNEFCCIIKVRYNVLYNIHVSMVYIVRTSFFLAGRGLCWASNQIFKKGRLDRISIFEEGLLGKRGVIFSGGGGGCSFYIRNKLKYEIFKYKKSLQRKTFFFVITKNLNWEVLTKNLVSFKRWKWG